MLQGVILKSFNSSCNALSIAFASVHYTIIRSRIIKTPSYLLLPNADPYLSLKKIWCAKLTRRAVSVLVRSKLRKDILQLVQFNIPLPKETGAVILTCHTTWKRLLVQWCLENHFAIIIANGVWTKNRGIIQRQGKGYKELKEIIAHLKQGKSIVFAADVFNNQSDCRVKFMGALQNASIAPIRIARLAGVPLITALPVLKNGMVHVESAQTYNQPIDSNNYADVMQNIIQYFDQEVSKNPSIWPEYV